MSDATVVPLDPESPAREPAGAGSTAERPLQAFRRLDVVLGRALDAARERYGEGAAADAFRGLYVTVEQASAPLAGAVGVPLQTLGSSSTDRHTSVPGWAEICSAHRGWAWLRARFGLGDRELDIVLIALAPEVDLRYERLYGYLQDDVARRRPTVDLALDLLAGSAEDKLAARAAFAADATLVVQRIVRLVPEQGTVSPLLAHTVKVDDQIVDLLLGQGGLDRRLVGWCRLLDPGSTPLAVSSLPEPEQAALVAAVESATRQRPLRIFFHGPEGSGRLSTAESVAAELGLPLLVADVARWPAPRDGSARRWLEGAVDDDEDLLALVLREAELQGAILYLQNVDLPGEGLRAPVVRGLHALARSPGTVILAAEDPWLPPGGPALGELRVSFGSHGYLMRRDTWARGLGSVRVDRRDLDLIATRYRLRTGQIVAAAAVALEMARSRAAAAGLLGSVGPTTAELVEAARRQGGQELARQARRIEPLHRWRDLVLPEDSLDQLRELCDRVAVRERVLTDWGFAGQLAQGRGCAALFAGPPGTGKTMAAEVIAGELGLDLYKIDLAARGQQVHRRDRAQPGTHLHRCGPRGRHPVLRRGGRTVRQAQRGA